MYVSRPAISSFIMKRNVLTAALISGFTVLVGTASAADLQQSFTAPPDEAKPLTWWHWIDGNVTKQGITGDLEAMKRAGLGGCYLFSIGGFFPQGPAVFGQPGWFDLLDHTVNEATRLGLTFGVHNCDGWSEAGGPWITPEKSMKELTWTSQDVSGPKKLEITLAQPATKEDFYRDIAVLAFPVPAGKVLNSPQSPVSGSINEAALRLLCDGQPETRAVFPVSAQGHRFQVELAQPQAIRSMAFRNLTGYGGDDDLPVLVEASANGTEWHVAGECSFAWDTADGARPLTVALNETEARFLRVSFTNGWKVGIGEVELSDAAKLHFAEAKAALLRARGHGGEARHLNRYPGPDRHRPLPAEYVLSKEKVVALTGKMSSAGRLAWDVPPGAWRILRIGYTSNGRKIKPATEAGRGLECDKLDPEAVRAHLDHYVGELAERFGPKTGKAFKVVETDSWECDIQNWTAGFEQRFKSRVGYDLLPWMPLFLEGWIMADADVSDRVLWDWRRFLADQIAENFFSQVSAYLKTRGITYVCEGSGRQMYLYDALGYQRHGDVPMGEFWVNSGSGQGVRVDNKVASSLAHISGRKIVASESYTSSAAFAVWKEHPYLLKPLGDRAFCAGVNQFVFHTFAHQPYEVTGPGFTMAIWGLHCNRANTWWEPGHAWMEYLARCHYLLREGRFVGDVLAFVGEDVPNRIGWRDELQPALPPAYDFDGCDARALFEAKVKDGRIVLPGGMEYRVLLLPNRVTLRPEILGRIAELAQAGAAIVGPRPTQSPSLRDMAKADRQVQRFAAEVWGDCDGRATKEHRVGEGRVLWGLTFPEIFERLGVAPDFTFTAASSNPEIIYLHRALDGVDFYFVANQKFASETITARFRAAGRQPELWDPATGAITRPAHYKTTAQGIELPLSLDPAGSVFVVFRQPLPVVNVVSTSGTDVQAEFDSAGALIIRSWGTGGSVQLSDGVQKPSPGPALPAPLAITGPWNVTFPPKLGAPKSARFGTLVSWPDRPEPGIRYFSGTATYSQEIKVPADRLGDGKELWLDLGSVQVMAEIIINGQNLGVLWKPPFRLNATRALKPGQNKLEIRVTNLWPNRMIGDEQLPDSMTWVKKRGVLPASWPDWLLAGQPRPDGRITFCTRKPYKRNDPLLESGLIGPVRLIGAVVR